MDKILRVIDLSTSFKTEKGYLKAINGVSFDVSAGEIVGIVGESGCGKSVTMQSIMQLYDGKGDLVKYTGSIEFEGKDLIALKESEMRKRRGKDIAMIFQDSLSALDPVYTIGEQIDESLRLHTKLSAKERKNKAIHLLTLVGINEPEKRLTQYPHEISGGMRQRIMIAIALSCDPSLLIADEPTTALDVTIQAQIIDLLRSLNDKLKMSVILITHDMAVVSQLCERVIVMYLGQVAEEADVNTLFDMPMHPYTRGLIRSIPSVTGDKPHRLYMIPGTVPLLSQIPKGCRFAPRCPFACEKCRNEMPLLREVAAGHKVRCWYPQESEK